MDGTLFKRSIFERICSDDNLIINLDDRETLIILQSRLGTIPDFASNEATRAAYSQRPQNKKLAMK